MFIIMHAFVYDDDDDWHANWDDDDDDARDGQGMCMTAGYYANTDNLQ